MSDFGVETDLEVCLQARTVFVKYNIANIAKGAGQDIKNNVGVRCRCRR